MTVLRDNLWFEHAFWPLNDQDWPDTYLMRYESIVKWRITEKLNSIFTLRHLVITMRMLVLFFKMVSITARAMILIVSSIIRWIFFLDVNLLFSFHHSEMISLTSCFQWKFNWNGLTEWELEVEMVPQWGPSSSACVSMQFSKTFSFSLFFAAFHIVPVVMWPTQWIATGDTEILCEFSFFMFFGPIYVTVEHKVRPFENRPEL